MIRTSERLKQGARLYYEQFMNKTSKEIHKYPEVNYPEKVEKVFFQRINKVTETKIEIVFYQRTYYKKVEGYRQINYQKHRILSETLFKEKNFSVKLDVTPLSLANLKIHQNINVSNNALGIISCIDEVECYPTWAQIKFLDLIHTNVVGQIKTEAKVKMANSDNAIDNKEKEKKANSKLIETETYNENHIKRRMISLIKKSINAGFVKYKVLKTILSLGIYNPYWTYKSSKIKAARLQIELDESKKNKERLIHQSHEIEDSLIDLKNKRVLLEANINKLLDEEEHQYSLDKDNIAQPFLDNWSNYRPDKKPLIKHEVNYEYNIIPFKIDEKNYTNFVNPDNENIYELYGLGIIGVIIIRNIETSSIYIGYSMDIGRSFNKLFKNFIPTNKLMLTEYRNSKIEDKTKLFEVKIKMVKDNQELLDTYFLFDNLFNGKYIYL